MTTGIRLVPLASLLSSMVNSLIPSAGLSPALTPPPRAHQELTPDPNGAKLSMFWDDFRRRIFDGARDPFRGGVWLIDDSFSGGVF